MPLADGWAQVAKPTMMDGLPPEPPLEAPQAPIGLSGTIPIPADPSSRVLGGLRPIFD